MAYNRFKRSDKRTKEEQMTYMDKVKLIEAKLIEENKFQLQMQREITKSDKRKEDLLSQLSRFADE